MKKKNPKTSLLEVKKALKSRDYADTHRRFGKLTKARRSILVDTKIYNSKQKMLKKMIKHVEKFIANTYVN